MPVRAAMLAAMLLCGAPHRGFAGPEPAGDDPAIAQSLAEMLRDARTVISNNQELINNPDIGNKGLTAKIVLDRPCSSTRRIRVDPARSIRNRDTDG